MKSINTNQEVWVKLTNYGKGKWLDEIGMDLNCDHPKDGEYINFQLWDLMYIFGKHIFISSPTPFVDNEIFFEDPTQLNKNNE